MLPHLSHSTLPLHAAPAGTAANFGYCKGRTKSGAPCRGAVDTKKVGGWFVSVAGRMACAGHFDGALCVYGCRLRVTAHSTFQRPSSRPSAVALPFPAHLGDARTSGVRARAGVPKPHLEVPVIDPPARTFSR